jgi:tetratricopeptide (TPR) repeat protein
MAKGKITRKELKEDEFRTFGMKVYTFVHDNSRLCFIVVIALVIAFISHRVYKDYQARALGRSNEIFTGAMSMFEAGMFETDQTRREAALKQAIIYAEQIIEEFPKSKAARQARYLEGNAYYFMNDFDRAISAFQYYINTAKDNQDRAKGFVALGYAFENKFFYNEQDQSILHEAEKAYDQAIDLGKGTYIQYQAMLCKARLLELRYKNDEAMEIYKKIIADRKKLEEKIAEASTDQGSQTNRATRRSQKTQAEMLSEQMKMLESLFSFEKTAELNLDRLKGEKL